MQVRQVSEAAVDLTWIAPCAESLVALTQETRSEVLWPQIRHDPGAVLLVVRTSCPHGIPSSDSLQDAQLFSTAQIWLNRSSYASWADDRIRPIYTYCLRQAFLSARLAKYLACNVDQAWLAGLLAPLGWLAAAAVNPASAFACLDDADLAIDPTETQKSCWGLDHAAIARRLCWRWRLPTWLNNVAGHLGLPVEIAHTLGGDPELFQIVQLAVGVLQARDSGLSLSVGATPYEIAARLGVPKQVAESAADDSIAAADELIAATSWQDPSSAPLLTELLRLAAENRKRVDVPLVGSLQQDVDRLQQAYEARYAEERHRLEEQKLSALAELAAGAGHEINNPLAVISGQAQYLLGHEENPDRQKCLQKIIGQSQRIHDIVTNLMQFARPSSGQKSTFPISDVIDEVGRSLQPFAEEQAVRLSYPEEQLGLFVHADASHLRSILESLVRNAIEAAGADGWATVAVSQHAGDVRISVEDSGEPPPPETREHLFDPFFSGRSAGRGRGLGLSTAWSLARVNGGEVRFDESLEGPTRFLLTLPKVEPDESDSSRNGHAPTSSHQAGPA